MNVLYNSIEDGTMMTVYENPCYHCYAGAIGECECTNCKHKNESYSCDVDNPVVVMFKDFKNEKY